MNALATAPATAVAPLHWMPRQNAAGRATVAPLKTNCSSCHLRELCLPCGMTGSDVERLDGLKFGRRKVRAGESLYEAGEKFQFLFAVRSGTFKSSLLLKDGREQVSGCGIL